MKYKNTGTFIILTIVFTALSILSQKLLSIDKLVYYTLSEQFTRQQLENYFDFQQRWQWVSYVIIPVFLLLKITLVSSVLYIGTFFYSKVSVTFKQLWAIALKAEFVFLLVGVAKIVWFYFFQTNYTLEDIQFFYPLSALNIVGYKGLEAWYIYPFQVLNLFEVAYIFILAYYIGKLTQTNTDRGLTIVSASYVPALVLWVVCVMFFTLSYS